MSTNEIVKSGKEYIGYDYKTITVNKENVPMMIDTYANFGWIPNDSIQMMNNKDTVTLNLKRERTILNKTELTRLQQHFEDCIDAIAKMERYRSSKAVIFALTIAFIGTAFLAGAVFAITATPPILWLCIVLGIPGIIGWALPYPVFWKLEQRRAAEIGVLVEEKYDEIHKICEKGNALIHK